MKRIPAMERRAALVDAAFRVVAERGIAAATTRAIVAEAGMSLASFHYAFESRDELMTELVRRVVEGEESALAPVIAADIDDAVTMEQLIRVGLEQFFQAVRNDPEHERAMFELTQYAMRVPGMEQLATAQYRRYYAAATAALQVAATKTGAGWNRPVEEVAVFLVTMTDGLTLGWLANRDDAAASATMDFAATAIAAMATDPVIVR
jgi:AcrR family transcriptional regulator